MTHESQIIADPQSSERLFECSCGYSERLGWFPDEERMTEVTMKHLESDLIFSWDEDTEDIPERRKLRMFWINDYGEEASLEDARPTLVEESSGGHYDQGKSRLELLDSQWINAVGDVLAYGSSKYGKEVGGGEHNWRKGIKVSRLLGSLLRHTFEVLRGNDIDAESGLPHIAHASCCAMFIYATLKSRPDLDDRYKEMRP